MRRTLSCMIAMTTALALVACTKTDGQAPAATPDPATPPTTVEKQLAGAQARIAGKVAETMDAAGYTYVLVDSGSEKVWAAVPKMAIKVGDPIDLPPGMPMQNFKSESLGRTFELVYFVDPNQRAPAAMPQQAMGAAAGEPGSMPEGHPQVMGGQGAEAAVAAGSVTKAEGGVTVEEIHNKKAALVGKPLAVRGKVVKFNANIMGKNWIHLRDGSGSEGSNDLTVTTAAMAKVGDTVLVKGTLVADKDFGAGYKYELIVEDAAVTAE
ncbi:MAG: OB-fold nucleic acid binding domain-containing protein [Pseudomonadota bacterium]